MPTLNYSRCANPWRRCLAAMLAIVLTASQAACVERRMIVRSNPPGAVLYVDDYPIGTTPCATSFIYYGTRQIRLVKDGYETLVVNQPIPAPWYEFFPADFVAENLVPGHIRDVRVLSYDLRPLLPVPNDQLTGRADALRAAVKAEQASEGIIPRPRVFVPRSTVPAEQVLPPPSYSLPAPQGYAPPSYAPPNAPSYGLPTYAPPASGPASGPTYTLPAQ
jgi:hypothetical protein